MCPSQFAVLTQAPRTVTCRCDRDKRIDAKKETQMRRPKALGSDDEIDTGCTFILGEGDVRQICGTPCKPASPYCRRHHALCHVAYGSAGESNRLREVE